MALLFEGNFDNVMVKCGSVDRKFSVRYVSILRSA